MICLISIGMPNKDESFSDSAFSFSSVEEITKSPESHRNQYRHTRPSLPRKKISTINLDSSDDDDWDFSEPLSWAATGGQLKQTVHTKERIARTKRCDIVDLCSP
mmetsp:Transcript_5506/g.8700  ORF Transcript_5506/g.8700 Transcript_5506/m.8700 type:complete len:105 (+) Transcript_5506:3-317(+)